MTRARALYLAVYESQGGQWEANDCKNLWCDKADRYLELCGSVAQAPTGHEWVASETVGPNGSGYYTAGIDIKNTYGNRTHYSAIEFHSKDKATAERRRDAVLASSVSSTHQPAETKQCSHPDAGVWFYRDDDVYMRCPDCKSRWCVVSSTQSGGAA